jgi:AcrR family transcriptional regulator
MGLREQKKAATRSAIMETSLMLFRTVGFDETRVHDVVGKLNISEATFFNYFPTKQSVLEAAAQTLLNRSLDLLRELSGDRRSIEERMERLVKEFAKNFAGDRGLATLLARHTRFLLVASDRVSERHELLTRLFVEGQARGEVRDDVPPAQLTDIATATNLVAISAWIEEADSAEPLEARLLAAHRVFWHGATGDRRGKRTSPRQPTSRPART